MWWWGWRSIAPKPGWWGLAGPFIQRRTFGVAWNRVQAAGISSKHREYIHGHESMWHKSWWRFIYTSDILDGWLVWCDCLNKFFNHIRSSIRTWWSSGWGRSCGFFLERKLLHSRIPSISAFPLHYHPTDINRPSQRWDITIPIKQVILHPGKVGWNPKMKVWKMILLFNWVILRLHVNFRGCLMSKSLHGTVWPAFWWGRSDSPSRKEKDSWNDRFLLLYNIRIHNNMKLMYIFVDEKLYCIYIYICGVNMNQDVQRHIFSSACWTQLIGPRPNSIRKSQRSWRLHFNNGKRYSLWVIMDHLQVDVFFGATTKKTPDFFGPGEKSCIGSSANSTEWSLSSLSDHVRRRTKKSQPLLQPLNRICCGKKSRQSFFCVWTPCYSEFMAWVWPPKM